jgi:hypothetical protein
MKHNAGDVGGFYVRRRVQFSCRNETIGGKMSALGHVWTTLWQRLSDVAAALVGCGHVCGLFVRRVRPLALMLCADRVPIKNTHFRGVR